MTPLPVNSLIWSTITKEVDRRRLSTAEIARDTGLNERTVRRFVYERCNMTVKHVDVLLRHLGLTVKKR